MSNDKWVSVADELPELEQDVLIAWWCDSKVNGKGFWVYEVGYLQSITKRKSKDSVSEYGEWKIGSDYNVTRPEFWQPIQKLRPKNK